MICQTFVQKISSELYATKLGMMMHHHNPECHCEKLHGGVPRVSKPVVGQSIALHALSAYRASTYLVSAFLAHLTSFSPNFFNLNGGMCIE